MQMAASASSRPMNSSIQASRAIHTEFEEYMNIQHAGCSALAGCSGYSALCRLFRLSSTSELLLTSSMPHPLVWASDFRFHGVFGEGENTEAILGKCARAFFSI